MFNAADAARANDLVSSLLDRGYDAAARATLEAISARMTDGAVATGARRLADEATRLAAAGERLTPDNPVLRAYFADLEGAGARNARAVADAGAGLRESGVTAAGQLTRDFAIGGVNDRQLASIGVRWNTPDPEAVARAVGYLESEGWRDEMARYAGMSADKAREVALRGIVNGWNPTRTAMEMRDLSQSMSLADANNLMRTLQLTSYRDASAIHQQANADILSHQIRIGTLDDRICMACIALHGTRLEVGVRVDDHHQGRCIGVAVVTGRNREVLTGEDWYFTQSIDRQRAIAGDSAYELLQSGRAQLRDFAVEYNDPTFGRMIREASAASLTRG